MSRSQSSSSSTGWLQMVWGEATLGQLWCSTFSQLPSQ